jgi:hypothetical protein
MAARIYRNAAPTPTGFADIASDDFPVPFHATGFYRFCSLHDHDKMIYPISMNQTRANPLLSLRYSKENRDEFSA